MEVLPVVPLHSLEGFGVQPLPPEEARGSLGDGGDTQGVCLSGMGLFSLPWLPSRALQLLWERRIGVKKQHLEMAKKGPGFAPVRGAGSGGGHGEGVSWGVSGGWVGVGGTGVSPGLGTATLVPPEGLFPWEVLLRQLGWDLGELSGVSVGMGVPGRFGSEPPFPHGVWLCPTAPLGGVFPSPPKSPRWFSGPPFPCPFPTR